MMIYTYIDDEGTSMPTMELTQVYLEPGQKKALRQRAKTNGSTLAQEARRAIDAYLAGVSPHELDVLDGATREAQKNLEAMAADLERVNSKLDAIFAEMGKNPTRRA